IPGQLAALAQPVDPGDAAVHAARHSVPATAAGHHAAAGPCPLRDASAAPAAGRFSAAGRAGATGQPGTAGLVEAPGAGASELAGAARGGPLAGPPPGRADPPARPILGGRLGDDLPAPEQLARRPGARGNTGWHDADPGFTAC